MGTVDLVNLAMQGALSARQKSAFKKRLVDRKRELAAAIKSIDQGLKALARKSKKRKAKRRAKR